jgi:hypothetical protein
MGDISVLDRSYRTGLLRCLRFSRGPRWYAVSILGGQLARRLLYQTLAPNLWAAVSLRIQHYHIVKDALSTGAHDLRWVADITHARAVQVLVQYLTVWDLVRDMRLTSDPDKFIWKWSPNGQYSSASAYSALFLGRIDILGARQIWKIQMLGKCKFFAWLALHSHCLTSDRLHRHALKDSNTCALCAQEVETLDHLLVDCVYTREMWFRTLCYILLLDLALDSPGNLAAWWCSARKSVAKVRRKGFDAFICLVALKGVQHTHSR